MFIKSCNFFYLSHVYALIQQIFGFYHFMGIVVLVFIVFCFKAVSQGVGEGTLISIKPFFDGENFSASLIISGAAMACFSFLGFDSITTLSEEALDPKRDIWKAAILSCFICGILFIVQAYAAQLLWPDVTTFPSSDAALFDIAKKAGGPAMATLYTVAVVASTLTAGLTGQSSASRLMFGMGRDQVLPEKFFTYLHPKFNTPVYNIMLMCSISIVGALLLPVSTVAELMNFGGLAGFMCVNLSVIVYYFFKKREKKVFRNLVIPALGFIICFYLWIHLSHLTLKVGFIWLVAGAVYLALTTRGFKKVPPVFKGI